MKCAVVLAILACAFIINSDGLAITNWGTRSANVLRNETIIIPPQVGIVQNRNFTFSFVSSEESFGCRTPNL